ncbi:MAG: hypothetical protein DME18_05060 [Verrucomicrobia bacterium]|nr:MAG: hypothetical protein DME18_05060 [Verrucomicrobiota bacterium]
MIVALSLHAYAAAGAVDARRGQPALSREAIEFFEKKVRPVLTEKCYKCHSAGAEKIKGGLLLDSRNGWMKGGESGPVIVPGDPEKSRLIHAVRHTDSSLQMPPKEILPASQIGDLETWVRMGAPDPRGAPVPSSAFRVPSSRHWAFLPLRNSPPPGIKKKNWPRSPVDSFILAGLEKSNLSPRPPADKRTLIRRATFDLTGLPPKPEEIEAFLADDSNDAFAKVVDRLLATPQFGERWGRHWLDVARYADSNGLEINLPYENAWRYRDYVVRAFNQDKPFDQFIREQLAGDLLPGNSDEQRYEQLTATGFLMLGPKLLFEPRKGKLQMDIVDEQIDVTTRAFLGLTVSCARCHDHKFDPIPTRDYYALAGIFASTATLASDAQPARGPPRWRERPLAAPEKAKAMEDHAAAVARLETSLQAAGEMKRALPGGVSSSELGGIVLDNTAAQLTGAWKESTYATNFIDKNYLQDGNTDKGKKSARFAPDLPQTGRYEVQFAYVPRRNRARNVPVTVNAANETRTVLIDQTEPPTIDNLFVSLGIFDFTAGTNGAVVISNQGTEGFVTLDAVRFVPAGMEMAMKTPTAQMARAKKAGPAMMDRSYYQLLDDLKELRANEPPPVPMAMAAQDGAIRNCRINLRGDPEKPGPEVPRGFLSALEKTVPSPAPLPGETSGRLELANWIASPDNPLTARVAVNRIWHHLFGGRLVESVDNFGVLGERPTHPELLDYLARRFMEQGGSFKKIIRTLMLSSTYQMSSELDRIACAKDPENKLMWRMNRRRLDAEAIRDAVLAVSGQLDFTMGGPLATTNDPPFDAVAMASNAQVASTRRSLYLPVIRNDTTDLFQVFDFADPHLVTGKRHSTTAPTQALFMMNSPFMLAQSRQWAEALMASTPTNEAQRVTSAYTQAFGRPAATEETERALQFIAKYQAALEKNEPDIEKRRLMAWQSFCHALLASTELRFID